MGNEDVYILKGYTEIQYLGPTLKDQSNDQNKQYESVYGYRRYHHHLTTALR
jgi:hypothetical protein